MDALHEGLPMQEDLNQEFLVPSEYSFPLDACRRIFQLLKIRLATQ